MNMNKLKELFEKQCELFEKDSIIITSFSFKDKDVINYRFYFKDMKSDYVYNPTIVVKNSKRTYEVYLDYAEGLLAMVEEANKYIKNN